jgi:hypothetical protein
MNQPAPELGTLEAAKRNLPPSVAFAIAKFRTGIRDALEEYIDETIHQGDTDNFLPTPEAMKDFGLCLQYSQYRGTTDGR